MFETEIEMPVRPASSRQLALVVRDASNSMLEIADNELGIPKAAATSIATRELVGRLQMSTKAANFSFAAIDFHDAVAHETPVLPLVDVDLNGDFDPTSHGTGGTFVGAGLESAAGIANSFLADTSMDLVSSVVFLVLSDGECLQPDATKAIASAIKGDPRISIAAAFFATKGRSSAGPALLQEICSDPVRLYRTVYDAETLRAFFEASLAISAIRAGIGGNVE